MKHLTFLLHPHKKYTSTLLTFSPNWQTYVTDTLSFNLPMNFSKTTEETKWCNVIADLLSGTIFVFDIDTQVYGQSRKQQMLQPRGVNTGICRMDTPSVAFLCTSDAWRQIHRHAARPYKLVWCCSGEQILITRHKPNCSILSNWHFDVIILFSVHTTF